MRRTRPGLEPRETRGTEFIAYAYEQPAREGRDRIIAEMKRMLASYLFPAQD